MRLRIRKRFQRVLLVLALGAGVGTALTGYGWVKHYRTGGVAGVTIAAAQAAVNPYFVGRKDVTSAHEPITLTIPRQAQDPTISIVNAVTGETVTTAFTITRTPATAIPDTDTITLTPKSQGIHAGAYEIRVTDPTTHSLLSQQDFSWGVVTFNPNFALYPLNEPAKLAMAVLDDRGKMVCDAGLSVDVSTPSGAQVNLSTEDGSITVSPDCHVYGPTTEPDFYATYQPVETGVYAVTVTAQNGHGTRILHDSFSVKANQDFYLERQAPTRLYPPVVYSSKLLLHAKTEGTYTVEEHVPLGFTISDTTAEVHQTDTDQVVTWNVTTERDKVSVLDYKFQAPNISPYLFTLGPAKITGTSMVEPWNEVRSWQLASDNACQSNVTTGNWSAAGSWTSCGGTTPQSADTVTILNGHTITQDSASVTVTSLTIDSGGTLDVSTTNAITVSSNWTNNGTFTANSSTVTFSSTSSGKTLGGTLTGGSGKFYNLTFNGVSGAWTFNAAVEAANDFLVTNGSVTASNNNLTVGRDFTLSNTSGVAYVAGSSTITITRNYSDVGNKFSYGTSTVAAVGTGSITASTFYNLSCGYSSFTSTVYNFNVYNVMTVNGGTVTTPGGASIYIGNTTSNTPFVFASATTLTGSVGLYTVARAGSLTMTVAGGNYGAWTVGVYATAGNNSVFQLGGNVTTTQHFLQYTNVGLTGITFNTQNYSLTAYNYRLGNTAGGTTANWGSSTITLANDLFVFANFGSHTINMGSASVTVRGTVTLASGTGSVTLSAGTSTITFAATSTGKSITNNGQSFYNVIFNGSGGGWSNADAMVITNDLTVTAGTLSGTSNITVNGNVACGVTCGTVTLTGGTFEQRVGASKNFGTSVAVGTVWTFYDLTFSNSGSSGFTITTSSTGTGKITVTSIMRVGRSTDNSAGITTLDAGNRTFEFSLAGASPNPFQQYIAAAPVAVLTPSTSTFNFVNVPASGNTTVQNTTYYNLTVNSSGKTFVLAGATTVNNTLTITAGTLDTTGSNYALTAASITDSGTLTANGSTITLTGTSGTLFTKGGTFTQGTSNVVVTSASGSPTLLSTGTTFNKLTINSTATIINAGGVITLSNTDSSNGLAITAGTLDDGGNTIVGTTNGTMTIGATGTLKIGSAATASTFPTNFTSGIITLDASSTVVYQAGVAQNVSATPTYGNLTVTPKSGTPTYSLTGATTAAGTVTISSSATLDATGSNYNLAIGGSYSNSGTFNSRSATVTFTATAGSKTLGGTMTSGSKFYNLTFNGVGGGWSMGANNVEVGNNLSIMNGTLTASSGNLTITNYYANSGTFTNNSGTVIMNATDTGNTLTGVMTGSSAFYNLTFNGSGGAWNFGLYDATVTNDVTITLGTVTAPPGTLTIGGSFSSAGTFTHNSGTVLFTATTGSKTISSTLLNTLTFHNLTFNGSGGGWAWTGLASNFVANDLTMTAGTLTGSVDIEVGGSITGTAGVLNLSGSLTLNNTTAETFGTTSGSANWTFANLTIGGFESCVSWPDCPAVTTSSGGTGTITVSEVLYVGDAAFYAGNRNWILSGTDGFPFLNYYGVFYPDTSTFTFNGYNGTTEITDLGPTEYYNLVVDNTDETFLMGSGDLTINGSLTITIGIFDTNSFDIFLAGDFTNTGQFNAGLGALVVNGTSPQTLSGDLTGSSALYDLSLSNASGTADPGCGVSFTPGVVLGASATVTGTYYVDTGAAVKVQYNSGSTYTVNDLSFGGSSGSRVQFRNSSLSSGTWSLAAGSVTGVSYVDTARSDASGGTQITANNGTNKNCGNNTNWNFGTPTTPTYTDLTQTKVTGGTLLGVGDYTSETQINLNATVSQETTTSDTFYLCVELKVVGVAFTNTEDSCTAGTAYSGSPITLTMTRTGLTDLAKYHWQARLKNAAGQYSGWVSYGNNAESFTDFGINTAPGTIREVSGTTRVNGGTVRVKGS